MVVGEPWEPHVVFVSTDVAAHLHFFLLFGGILGGDFLFLCSSRWWAVNEGFVFLFIGPVFCWSRDVQFDVGSIIVSYSFSEDI